MIVKHQCGVLCIMCVLPVICAESSVRYLMVILRILLYCSIRVFYLSRGVHEGFESDHIVMLGFHHQPLDLVLFSLLFRAQFPLCQNMIIFVDFQQIVKYHRI